MNYCVKCAKCGQLYWTLSSQCESCTNSEENAQAKRIEELEGCLLDMLQSYELCTGDKSAFNDVAKDAIRGFFIGVPERAKKVLEVKQ